MTEHAAQNALHNARFDRAFHLLDRDRLARLSGVDRSSLDRVLAYAWEMIEAELSPSESRRAAQQTHPAHGRHP